MHFILSYDLSASGVRRNEVEEKINEIIKPHKWAKRLSTLYILEVHSDSDWNSILQQLQNLSNNIPEKFEFIMSPAMHGGRYDGSLKTGDWDFVNEITGVS